MPRSKSTWQPGQSGNPRGRPPKSRALTALLEQAGSRRIPADDGGAKLARRQLLARHIWQGLTEGEITFPNGRTLFLDAGDYLALARLVLTQIDGPPPAAVDVTSAGEPVPFSMIEVVKQVTAQVE
jgi:hypothetical protein